MRSQYEIVHEEAANGRGVRIDRCRTGVVIIRAVREIRGGGKVRAKRKLGGGGNETQELRN